MTTPWDDSLSVGISEFDAHHKRLLTMVHRLADPSEARVDPETVSGILPEMREYATVHFKAEEKLMEEHGYPYLGDHHQEHILFIQKLVDLTAGAASKPMSADSDLLAYLITWWNEHILKVDMKYRGFFMEKGVRS